MVDFEKRVQVGPVLNCFRLNYKPLFGKGARSSRGKTPDPRERLKLSLELHVAKSRYTGLLTNYLARVAGKLAVF